MTLNNRTYSLLLMASGTLALVCQLNPASRAEDDSTPVDEIEVVSIVDDHRADDHRSEESGQHREATKRKMADIESRIVDLKHAFADAKENGEADRAEAVEREIDELHQVLKELRSQLKHSGAELTEDERHVLGKYEELQLRARKMSEMMQQLKEEGRHKEAERVAQELRELKEHHAELHERAITIQKRHKGIGSESEVREVQKIKQKRAQGERLELLMVSARNLEQAGFPDLAHEIRVRADQLHREAFKEVANEESERRDAEARHAEREHAERVHAELMEQMHQMKMQIEELRNQVHALNEKTRD